MTLSINELKQLLPDARLDKRQKNLYSNCPKCGENEFGISLDEDHTFGCFRKKQCGFTGNIYTLLRFLGKDISTVGITRVYNSKLKGELKTVITEEVDLSLKTISLPVGFKRVMSHPYLDNREFSLYDKFEVGITTIHPRLKNFYVIFALRQYGDIKGYVARHIWTKKQIEKFNKLNDRKIKRYINSETDFAKMLGGIDEVSSRTHTIILVEGLFDKEGIDRKLGLDDQDEIKCCNTYKCKLSIEQMYQLQQTNVKKIIMFYDPDVLDEIKTNAFEAEQYFEEVLIAFNDITKEDPADMSIETMCQVLEQVQTPSQFFTAKLNSFQLR